MSATKKTYFDPELEIVNFNATDVIVTSGCGEVDDNSTGVTPIHWD